MRAKHHATITDGALRAIHGAALITRDGRYNRSAIIHKARREMKRGLSWSEAQRYAWRVARGQMTKAREYDASARFFRLAPIARARQDRPFPQIAA